MNYIKKIILIIIIVIIVFFAILFVANFIYPPIKQKIDIARLPNDYYKSLAQECKTTGSYGCCISSVNSMAANGYKLKPKDDCPEGYQSNMLRCITSFKWCEPIKAVIQNDECDIENSEFDSNGYLLKICQYLKRNNHQDIYHYSIREVTEGQYSRYEDGEWKTTDVIKVKLDCCYMGDLAYIDKETKEVIGFSPGDK